MGRLTKFWFLNPLEKRVFIEALILLLLSHLSVKTIAFKHLYSLLHARWKDQLSASLDRSDDIRLINLSLLRAAGRLPFESRCLSRSIAAFVMLRRRGIPAVIFAGVKFEDSSFLAHAWVCAGSWAIDYPRNAAFTPLMRIGQGPVDR